MEESVSPNSDYPPDRARVSYFNNGLTMGRANIRECTAAKSRATPSSCSSTPLHSRSSVARRLNKYYGLNTEVLDLVEGAWSGRDGGDEEAVLMEDPEKLVPATPQRPQRSEIVQEHFGYAPTLVSLRGAAFVMRRSVRLSACSVATVALQMCYVSGIGKDAGLAEAPAVGVSDDSE
ncbi:hypothetical protein EDB84DRAFT_224881 [Lactarius hengduanensis]|nr:hypothetical protein EDB84DRAFT_1136111 [Lactarius hengduanensis]KAH9029728.1 hypothetical protein EDB84DRAFT_224881 [Lactarius hengduanensis]